MKLSQEIRNVVVSSSFRHIGREKTDEFSCMHFVIEVYEKIGVTVPIIPRYDFPPNDFNITKEDLSIWEYGYPIFFRRYKYSGEKRIWTHTGITLPEGKIIHLSSHLGGRKVSINSKEEIFEIYQYISSS